MNLNKLGFALLTLSVISGCSNSSKMTPVKFTQLVSFGDSLSDVGTYRVGTVQALGGGEFTVNAATDKIWVEDIANALALPAPCAAQTGLNGAAKLGFSVPVSNHAGCDGYAQGGARVTNPVGPGNALLGGSNALIGMLTVPVVTQIQNYLGTTGGNFTGTELVTVWAGANDIFIQADTVALGLETPTDALDGVSVAGTEMAGYINNEMIAKGANHIVVLLLPDISLTPMALAEPAQSQTFLRSLTTMYNDSLTTGLASAPAGKVMIFDTYSASQAEAAAPAKYGLTNVTATACNLDPTVNPLSSSLVCSANNLNSGTNGYYEYADDVHPTPYAHALVAKGVLTQMSQLGWY